MSLQTALDLIRLRRNLGRKPSELREMQNRRLNAIIRHAYRNVEFYHRKLKDVNVIPDDIKSIKDLGKIPMTTKHEIQSASFQRSLINDVDPGAYVTRRTSGSIGQPLTVALDRGTARFEEALWFRAMFENGLRLRDKMAVIHDPSEVSVDLSWLRRFGLIRRQYISIFDDPDQQLRLLGEYKPEVVKGYPSALTIIAELLKERQARIRPRLIFTGAELLDKRTRKSLSSAFDAEIFDYYGCHEFSLLAWECRQHMGYHINVDSVVMEFIDDEEEVSSGERGEIVCTGLINRRMPLIRYRVGDIAVPAEEQCSCGITLPLMKIVEGRADDFLLTLDGRLVSPLIFFPYPFDNVEWMRQFRIIQENRDKLVVEIATKGGLEPTDETLEKARLKLIKLFGADMRVEFQTVDRINGDSSGKIRKIISRIAKSDGSKQEVVGQFSVETKEPSKAPSCKTETK